MSSRLQRKADWGCVMALLPAERSSPAFSSYVVSSMPMCSINPCGTSQESRGRMYPHVLPTKPSHPTWARTLHSLFVHSSPRQFFASTQCALHESANYVRYTRHIAASRLVRYGWWLSQTIVNVRSWNRSV
ncbi:hypothetical protein H310_04763 [Aphanomyces invadans]|uniref:Uncharacterized protein n=1 Tax=Aphanomyces invadans TaxID=157072 RepID=A0A024UFV8_9STRA|nr:hypothetical protein H310_04763 [Aphanomyces invadans]ETW04503.1 hypothetical protein H310_04763 [Aphanomyces invadans]|eukprot:XP_008867459.1 hypothetical protein H310_04763 [Aphanomyces invadans]